MIHIYENGETAGWVGYFQTQTHVVFFAEDGSMSAPFEFTA